MANPVIASYSEHASGNVFTKPTGLANGDVLYIDYWQFHDSATMAAPPTGFTAVVQTRFGAGADQYDGSIFRKVITNAGGEPASYTVTRGGGNNWGDGGKIIRVTGVDSTTPENDTDTNSGSGTTFSTGSITTTVADCLLWMLVVTGGQGMSTPSGMTLDLGQDGGDASHFRENFTGTVSGITRSAAINASTGWTVSTIAISPTTTANGSMAGAVMAATAAMPDATMSPVPAQPSPVYKTIDYSIRSRPRY